MNSPSETKHAFSAIGVRTPRKGDARYLRGAGIFIADIQLSGMRELAFVRSPVAHARIRSIAKPGGAEAMVFTNADLVGIRPIMANATVPGFRPSAQTALASDKVRHVGEAIAACVARTRAEAEDLAAAVRLDLDELPAVGDMHAARAAGAPLIHENWPDNIILKTFLENDGATFPDTASIVIRRQLRTARQCMSPLEGRGVVALWDRRLEQLLVYSSTQMPHIIRNGLAECLDLSQERIRVVAPDVGGGFGYKGILLPEEICAAYLTRHLGYPLRWIEDRQEQLVGNANCREHWYDITAKADRDGRLISIEAEAIVDSGAYSTYPFSAGLEAAQIASILPGPYKFDSYRCTTWSVATNKPGILPYRGVARAGVCYAMEVVMDAIAHEAGMEPHEVRLKNLVQPKDMPFDNISRKHFDSGDYPECLRRVVTAIDLPLIRRRQREETGHIRTGIGLSIFCEQGAHGTSVYSGWGIPMVPGFEQAAARLTPDGGLEIRVGIQSHGQGLETTLAQVASEILGIAIERIKVVHGDTALTPYSTGTWGSRCMVMAGGAVAAACRDLGLRIGQIGAHLLQTEADLVQVGNARVSAGLRSIGIEEVAQTWYLRPQDLPMTVASGGLEVVSGYKAARDTGTFSYAAHAVVVAVDTELGTVRLTDYAVCEDGGVLINPMIVDGQVIGGVAQGIGTALYEEMPFDANAQPMAPTMADYILPGATEVPVLRIDHMETPSPYTEFGQKGIGEGGAIGPPAAIANAVNDALRPFGVEILELPITPRRILAALLARA